MAGEVSYVNFNQDAGCFACSTPTGFRIYNSDPMRETLRRDLEGGEVAIVEMVFRSNLLALVGVGNQLNKVVIWDDDQSRAIGELIFRTEVRAVRMRRDRIVVVLEHKVHVYDLSDLSPLHEIETFANRRGTCAVSPASSAFVLACPGTMRAGEVRIESFSSGKRLFVQAHESPLACIALNHDGTKLTTASTKGTIVRIFSTIDGTLLQELRRGAERADIFSLALSSNSQWLVLSSDKCTVHVFSLTMPQQSIRSALSLVASSSLVKGLAAKSSLVKGMLPSYLNTSSSFAQFRLPQPGKAIVAFGPQKNTIIVVCSNGSYYRCAYDPERGGDMVQQEYASYILCKLDN